jgi:hypothetical protein
MRKKNQKQEPALSPDSLLETNKKGEIELTELNHVTGGRSGVSGTTKWQDIELPAKHWFNGG